MSEYYYDPSGYGGGYYGGGDYRDYGGYSYDPGYYGGGYYGGGDPYTQPTEPTTRATEPASGGDTTRRRDTTSREVQQTVSDVINSVRVADLVSGLMPTLQVSGENPTEPSIVIDGQVKQGGYGISFVQLLVLILVLGGVLYAVTKLSD